MPAKPRVLIEDWLPAAAIGVECMREENNPVAKPPTKYFHVWWARRPLAVSRAAVLGSLLPANFPRDVFERLLGFGHGIFDWTAVKGALPPPDVEILSRLVNAGQRGATLVFMRSVMDRGVRIPGGFGCGRAFNADIAAPDLEQAHSAARELWRRLPCVVDPMAGGGSIPLESARLGFTTYANEYNPVACSVLEATIDYPFRFGAELGALAAKWGKVLEERITERLAPFYPRKSNGSVHAYIYARTVPCPNTGHPTPLVPDWHLLKPKGGVRVVAVPVVDRERGTWTIQVRRVGRLAGEVREAPRPTYKGGNGISLFDGLQISSDYIKAKAQQGEMRSHLYAVAVKTPQGLEFYPPERADLLALQEAECELERLRPGWERNNIIPSEGIPLGSKTKEPHQRGLMHWGDLFSPRQLLCMGTLVEEVGRLRREVAEAEGDEVAKAITLLLALCVDKYADYNSSLSIWHSGRGVVCHVFEKHDFSFKSTFSELAPTNLINSRSGLAAHFAHRSGYTAAAWWPVLPVM